MKRASNISRYVAALILILGLIGIPNAVLTGKTDSNEKTKQTDFSVLSWNILWKNTDARGTVDTILQNNASIVCLQETTQVSEKFLRRGLSSVYPFMEFYTSRVKNGPAVISRLPIRNSRYKMSTEGVNGYWIGEVKVDDTWVQVANVHLCPPFARITSENGYTKALELLEEKHEKEIQELYGLLKPSMPTIVLGDFNSLPLFRAPKFLREKGFIDAWVSSPEHEGPDYTIAPRINTFSFTMRIDYIFHSFEFKTNEARVVRDTPSDHNLLYASLTLNTKVEE
jgi:endonuclease/exonuclease/phosphatase family metal-dependent hydrolase